VLAGFEALDHDGDWLVRHGQNEMAEGVLAGGDTLGIGIAGNAIVQGRRAAETVHASLRGLPGLPAESPCAEIGPDRIRFEHHPASRAIHAPVLPAAERIVRGDAETHATISEQEFLAEVQRCYSCGSCFGCEQCAMYCTSGCFTPLEEAAPGLYFNLSLDACRECGKCIEVCPCGYLEVT
jgi:Pyruvate/2-oxoacid:ferredoxin oxidoreductase delta subunit